MVGHWVMKRAVKTVLPMVERTEPNLADWKVVPWAVQKAVP